MALTQLKARLLKLLGTGGLADDGTGNVFVRGLQQIIGTPSGVQLADAWFDVSQNQPQVMTGAAATPVAVTAQTMIGNSSAVSAAIANTTTNTAFNQTVTIPANYFKVGHGVRLKWMVVFSTTGAPTITLESLMGTTVVSGPFGVVTASGASNNRYLIEMTLICYSTGTSGSFGRFGFQVAEQTTTTLTPTGGSTVTIDTTAATTVSVKAQWSVASVSNTCILEGLTVEGF